MSDIDTIIGDDIVAKITGITTDNGFVNNVSSLDGWLVHYANDLLDPDSNIQFPAVAVQPLVDTPNSNSSNSRSKNERKMRLMGAVSVTDPALVNTNINSLLLDVRRALAFDEYDKPQGSKASSIEYLPANFNLPDSQDQYAFFEMDIIIKYVENWK